MERRNFIRALIGITIGVPIAVEGATFSTLFYKRLTGNDGPPEREGEVFGEGAELLPGTQPTDTITDLTVTETAESEWTYTIEVAVENTTEQPYRLKLGPLSLADGSTVGDTVTSGTIDPSASETVLGEWTIPAGSTVDAVWAGGKLGSADSVTELVPLERIEPAG